jgi:hypothetical protein
MGLLFQEEGSSIIMFFSFSGSQMWNNQERRQFLNRGLRRGSPGKPESTSGVLKNEELGKLTP